MSWRLAVDAQRCMGSGICAGVAPDHFVLDDDTSRPVADSPAPDELVLDAADSCPAMAIAVFDGAREIGPRP